MPRKGKKGFAVYTNMIVYNDLRLPDCGKVSISCLSTSIFCILTVCLCTAFLQVFISSPAFSEEWTLYFPRLNTVKGSVPWVPTEVSSQGSISTAHTLPLYICTYINNSHSTVKPNPHSWAAAGVPADERIHPVSSTISLLLIIPQCSDTLLFAKGISTDLLYQTRARDLSEIHWASLSISPEQNPAHGPGAGHWIGAQEWHHSYFLRIIKPKQRLELPVGARAVTVDVGELNPPSLGTVCPLDVPRHSSDGFRSREMANQAESWDALGS